MMEWQSNAQMGVERHEMGMLWLFFAYTGRELGPRGEWSGPRLARGDKSSGSKLSWMVQ